MSMFFDGLGQLAEHFEKLVALQDEVLHEAAEAASVVVQANVKNVFGDLNKLDTLNPRTIKERVRLGFTPNDPLLRSGSLRESVKREVFGPEAIVGSADERAEWHEFGYHWTTPEGKTVWVPPRPAFEIGMHDSKEEVLAIAESAAGVALGFMRLNPAGEET